MWSIDKAFKQTLKSKVKNCSVLGETNKTYLTAVQVLFVKGFLIL